MGGGAPCDRFTAGVPNEQRPKGGEEVSHADTSGKDIPDRRHTCAKPCLWLLGGTFECGNENNI